MSKLYRVRVKSAGSLQPDVTFWRSKVLYCGCDKTEALVVYHSEEPQDFFQGYGNPVRETVFEVLDSSKLDDNEVGEFVVFVE